MKPNFVQDSSICQGQDSAQAYMTATAEFVLSLRFSHAGHGAGDSKGAVLQRDPGGSVGSLEHGAQGLLS